MTKKTYTVLDRIECSADVSLLGINSLKVLCNDVREYMIETVSQTGGHLGAGLGVVELTVALHKVFNTPQDKITWDVGHQTYPHKILTGRKDKMLTMRQENGLSGFTKRAESLDDCFGAGHSSTSISSALGMAVAMDLNMAKNNAQTHDKQSDNTLNDHTKTDSAPQPCCNTNPCNTTPCSCDGRNTNVRNNAIAVIGDGALSGGMAYEALNHAGGLGNRLIVILNANEMSIAPSVGGLNQYLSKALTSPSWLNVRSRTKDILKKLPAPFADIAGTVDEYARGVINGGGTMFEQLGFHYVGPFDGHNIEDLVSVLENIRDMEESRPVLIHVVTEKGKGYHPAENSKDKYHGVSKFCIETGQQKKGVAAAPSYTKVFAECLTRHADTDPDIVVVTPAMPVGSGIDIFEKSHPDRAFDVGIAEQHCVTFSAGLACEGKKVFCAVYSTFLQRGYDQVVHDVAVQNLPVRFAIDRAGYVGEDGATHAGMFDIAFLSNLPNMVVMAASDEAELSRMMTTAVHHNDSPIALRYPRGNGVGVAWDTIMPAVEIGKANKIQTGKTVAILSLGCRLQAAKQAVQTLQQETDITTTIYDMRFAKPFDTDAVKDAFENHDMVLTIEEGVKGGFGSLILEYAAQNDMLGKAKVRTMTMPDAFIDHAPQERQYEMAGLTSADIIRVIKTTTGM